MKRREFISLFAGVAAAWALEAFGQESATTPETNATKSTLPQIEIVRVRPVDGPPVNLRLRDGARQAEGAMRIAWLSGAT